MRNQTNVSELNENSNFQVYSISACHLQLNSKLAFCVTENIGINFKSFLDQTQLIREVNTRSINLNNGIISNNDFIKSWNWQRNQYDPLSKNMHIFSIWSE